MPDPARGLVQTWRKLSVSPWLRPWTERRIERQWIAAGRLPPPPPIVKQLIVKRHQARYDLQTLIETGTFTGDMVAAMLPYFHRIITIEYDPSLAAAARRRFAGAGQVTVIEGDSATLFSRALAELREPALCWLDAHFTGGATAGKEQTVPVMTELSAVAASRVYNHVVLIDDARCFGGENGFPTLREVREFCEAHGGRVEVGDDIIRWYPET